MLAVALLLLGSAAATTGATNSSSVGSVYPCAHAGVDVRTRVASAFHISYPGTEKQPASAATNVYLCGDQSGSLKIRMEMLTDPGFSTFTKCDGTEELLQQEVVQIVLGQVGDDEYTQISVTPPGNDASSVVQVSTVDKENFVAGTAGKPPQGKLIDSTCGADLEYLQAQVTMNVPWGGWSADLNVPLSLIDTSGTFEANFFRVYMPWGELDGGCPWPPTNDTTKDCEYSAWHGSFPSTAVQFKSLMRSDGEGSRGTDGVTIGVGIVIAWICLSVCMFIGSSTSADAKQEQLTYAAGAGVGAGAKGEVEMNAAAEIHSPLAHAEQPRVVDGFQSAGVDEAEAGKEEEEDHGIDEQSSRHRNPTMANEI